MKKLLVFFLLVSGVVWSDAIFDRSLTPLYGVGRTLAGRAVNIFAAVKNPWAAGKFKVVQTVDELTGMGPAAASVMEGLENGQRRKTFDVAMGIKNKQLEMLLHYLSQDQQGEVGPKLKEIEKNMGVQGVQWVLGSKKIPIAWRKFRARRVGMTFNEEDKKGHWFEDYILSGSAAGLFYLSERFGENRGGKKQQKKDEEQRVFEGRVAQNIILKQQNIGQNLPEIIAKSAQDNSDQDKPIQAGPVQVGAVQAGPVQAGSDPEK